MCVASRAPTLRGTSSTSSSRCTSADMRNAVLIANPRAGQGGPAQRQEAIRRFCLLLKGHGVDVEVRPTLGPNDATRLAREAANEGFRDIIVSGGDGTINEALQGLIGANVRLGIWARGTA